MGYFSKFLGVAAAVTLLSATVVGAEEKDPLKPRVPPDQIADAKALKNPIASSPESIAKGKALFEGKGTCFNCHGKEGKGDGPAGAILNPSPRNFTNCKFHKKRKDGEFFWVIKNGSAGTGMVSLDSRRDHRRRSVDHHQLRAEFLQRRRVISSRDQQGVGDDRPPPLFFVLTLPANQGCSEARTAASLVRASPLAGSVGFNGGTTAGRCS